MSNAAISYQIDLSETNPAAGGPGQGLEAVTAGTNPPAAVQATVTAASAVISAANAFIAGQPVYFTGSFGTVTGLTAGTTYYVIATGLSATQFEVAATPGGTAITPAGSSSAVVMVNGIGLVEVRIDQTTTAVTDAAYTGGTRQLKKGEAYQLLNYLEQYLLRDTNLWQ